MLHRTGEGSGDVDVNSRRGLFAALYMAVIGPEVFIVQPGFVQGMVQYLGFSEQAAGDIASAEMWGIALTTVAMTLFAARFDWRRVFAVSLIVMVLGNLASLLAESAPVFGVLRFVCGLGAGGVVSLSFAVVGLTANPDRNFGWLIMWVLIYGAVVLFAMPTVYAVVGMNGVLLFFAIFPASGLLFTAWLPRFGAEHAQIEQDAVSLPRNFTGMALVAMFCYFLGQGVVWAYLFLIGVNGGATEQQVANGLTASQFAGVCGALCAALIGSRFGRARPLSLAILLTLLPLFLLFGRTGAWTYAIAVCIYNYGWNLTHPYLLAAMASFDRAGRVVVYAVAFQMLGLANGPWIAARVIREDDYSNVLWLGVALFAASLALILPPVFKQREIVQVRKPALSSA
ncbi:MAG: MFS transporter [Gammaproteobacteria bacterium]|nr:MFS transporter [Gammaproteobacteria bacterium]